MGEIVRNGIIGNAIKLEVELHCTEQDIEGKDKFLPKALDEFIKPHTGALAGIRVTEDMFHEQQKNSQREEE